VEVGNRIQDVDNLNSLADQTSSTELDEEAGIDHLIEEILEEPSADGKKFNPQDPYDLFTLNLEIISTLQKVREKDPTHFRILINQSLDPDSLTLPDDFQEDAINPFNHLLLTKAFCDPTKKLYQEHNSAEHDVSTNSFESTQKYIDQAINLYRSEQKDRLKIDQETSSTENEEYKLNEEFILSLIDKFSRDPDAHNQSIENITDVYFNLLANQYFTAANHLLEGEIIKAFKPNKGLETESAEIQQHLLTIYDFARKNMIIDDITKKNPELQLLFDDLLRKVRKEGTN
jgi:hypothetical protein